MGNAFLCSKDGAAVALDVVRNVWPRPAEAEHCSSRAVCESAEVRIQDRESRIRIEQLGRRSPAHRQITVVQTTRRNSLLVAKDPTAVLNQGRIVSEYM